MGDPGHPGGVLGHGRDAEVGELAGLVQVRPVFEALLLNFAWKMISKVVWVWLKR